jgi:hypothetical protein
MELAMREKWYHLNAPDAYAGWPLPLPTERIMPMYQARDRCTLLIVIVALPLSSRIGHVLHRSLATKWNRRFSVRAPAE